MRPVALAVMVHIMLAVMLFALNMARLHILRMLDAACFPACNGAVGSGLLLHFFDSRLAFFKTRGFTLTRSPHSAEAAGAARRASR